MRKPLWDKGFQRERATGVEPATSSLGNVKRAFPQVRGIQRNDRDFWALDAFCVFPDCPEKARIVTKTREPFPVEPEVARLVAVRTSNHFASRGCHADGAVEHSSSIS